MTNQNLYELELRSEGKPPPVWNEPTLTPRTHQGQSPEDTGFPSSPD